MKNKNILIIDDDIELCEELNEALNAEGFSSEYVNDPFLGEKLIRNRSYDILILDYKMPGLKGADLLKIMKSENIKKKVFIISGRPFIENLLEEESLNEIVKGVITKPINFEFLLEFLHKCTA